MPAPIIPIALGLLGLLALAKNKGNQATVDITKVPDSPEGRALQLYAMANQPSMDPKLIPPYIEQIRALNVRPDLVAALEAKISKTAIGPEMQALQIYTNYINDGNPKDIEQAAAQIQALGVRPDLVDALMAKRSTLQYPAANARS